MRHHLWTIGRLTVLEARRNRLLWLVLAVALAGLMLAQFFAQVAITETDAIRITLMAALYRLAAVFILTSFVIASTQREFADKGVELTLSLSVDRASFCLGKLTGFTLCALTLAALFSLVLIVGPRAPVTITAIWGASLASELVLVATMATFCAFSLASSTGAFAAVLGFYLLSRSVGAMQIIAAATLADEPGVLAPLLNGAVEAITLLLPRLDLFTRSEWLTGSAPSQGELAIVAGQAALYVTLLAAATLFDFYRKEI